MTHHQLTLTYTAPEARNALEAAALAFHEANPHVYEAFEAYALEAVGEGMRIGAKTIWELLRWDYRVEVHTRGDEFKLNNNHTAYYARMFADRNPNHAEFFRTRGVRR